MRAIDTNVIIRFLTADDAVQAKAARKLMEDGDIFLGLTVLLEAEWVLRAGYGLSVTDIVHALRALAGLPGVTIEDPAQLALAFDWTGKGMDFADALHLAEAGHSAAFVTFDRKQAPKARQSLCRYAGRGALIPPA